MYRGNVRLNEECHTCVVFSKGTCGGKESRVPCLAYKSKKQYEKESIETIKKMVRN